MDRRWRLVRWRNSRNLACLHGGTLLDTGVNGLWNPRGARSTASQSRGNPWWLALSARSAGHGTELEMVLPAPCRRQQAAHGRSMGQPGGGDNLARRRQYAGHGGIRGGWYFAFCQGPAPRRYRPERGSV